MLTNVTGAKCVGIDALRVTVEIEIQHGIGIHLVGLPDVAVKESLMRTLTALESLGYRVPGRKIIINLAPADMHKRGSGYDLPIALGIIAASGQAELPLLTHYLIMGELGLDGSVRNIQGALPFAELAQKEGLKGVVLPYGSALEAVEFNGLQIFGVRNLNEAVELLRGEDECRELRLDGKGRQIGGDMRALRQGDGKGREAGTASRSGAENDFSDIIGQAGAKRGLEICAAGLHNAILIGPPGSGKSSLAKALAGILPPMGREESLVTSKIYSVAGIGDTRCGLMRLRPFRAPHYSASLAALIGGGSGDIKPGEVSLAHNGVLFLDELAQMPKAAIEALRGPLEDRNVSISRLRSKVEFPASFMLVAASNPCPCGYWGDNDRCCCTPTQRMNYLARLSGPIMDRIDVQLFVKAVSADQILEVSRRRSSGKECQAESSAQIAERVRRARLRQTERQGRLANSELNNRQVEEFCPLSPECIEIMGKLMSSMGFSMRAYYRIIKVARTIADLEGSAEIEPRHLEEAASFRFLDRMNLL